MAWTERMCTVRSTVGTPKRSVRRVKIAGYQASRQRSDQRRVVRSPFGEADPTAGFRRSRRAVPRRAGDVAELVALTQRHEPRRIVGVLDLVGIRKAREARVGERRSGVVERGERRLRRGDQPVALAEASREVADQPAGALDRDHQLRRTRHRRGEVVDRQRSGVPAGVVHLGHERLHHQRGDVAAVGSPLDPPPRVDAGVVDAIVDPDDSGVGVEARWHDAGQ